MADEEQPKRTEEEMARARREAEKLQDALEDLIRTQKELKDIEDIYYLRIDEFERAYSRIKYGETEATGPRLHFR